MMPAYNAEAYIGEAISSVLRQSYPHFELIVVDDGSEDETAGVLREFDDQRLRIIEQANQGEAAARNRALEAMQGDYLAFLDADDRFQPDHLERTVGYLESHPEDSAVYTDGHKLDGQGVQIGLLSDDRRGPFKGDIFEHVLRASDVFGPPICVVLRSALIRSHRLRFASDIVIGPDWDFLLQVAAIGRFGYLDHVTCDYRIHKENITFTTGSGRRRQSLARCRSRAIQNPRFSQCSLETKSFAFYDLLVNHLIGEPEAQQEVLGWEQFANLPEATRSRLMRLMASRSMAFGVDEAVVQDWLRNAIEINPFNFKALVLFGVSKFSPRLSRSLLTRHYPPARDNSSATSYDGAYTLE